MNRTKLATTAALPAKAILFGLMLMAFSACSSYARAGRGIREGSRHGGATRGLVVRGDVLLVGNGSRIMSVSMRGRDNSPQERAIAILPGIVHSLAASENRLFVGLGTTGFCVLEMHWPDGADPEVECIPLTGQDFTVSVEGDRLAVSGGTGGAWLFEGLSGGPLQQVGHYPVRESEDYTDGRVYASAVCNRVLVVAARDIDGAYVAAIGLEPEGEPTLWEVRLDATISDDGGLLCAAGDAYVATASSGVVHLRINGPDEARAGGVWPVEGYVSAMKLTETTLAVAVIKFGAKSTASMRELDRASGDLKWSTGDLGIAGPYSLERDGDDSIIADEGGAIVRVANDSVSDVVQLPNGAVRVAATGGTIAYLSRDGRACLASIEAKEGNDGDRCSAAAGYVALSSMSSEYVAASAKGVEWLDASPSGWMTRRSLSPARKSPGPVTDLAVSGDIVAFGAVTSTRDEFSREVGVVHGVGAVTSTTYASENTAGGMNIAMDEDAIVTAEYFDGLSAFRSGEIEEANTRASINPKEIVWSVDVRGDVIYAGLAGGIRIYRIHREREIRAVATLPIEGDVVAIQRGQGTVVYAAHRVRDTTGTIGEAGLVAVDVADPASPRLLASIPLVGEPADLTVSGQRVAVALGRGGLTIVDSDFESDTAAAVLLPWLYR
ncbi:MAG: hypothetical protein ABI780_06100 [Ardenticatenales bacterium]